ncbi:hypothetical protein ACPEF8_14345 [Klebsiella sp. K796]|uniref:hypothetical protein n=1 Tax=Klebsiella sp. K796 TaxID=3369403 RepID=UPI003C2BB936
MALLETLVATAMGGGFALLGSYLTNKFARQNSEEQRKHEKWKAKRDSYLAKGEETHALFNQWMINAAKISTIYSFRMSGAYNAEEVALRLKNVDVHNITPKLTALIEIYFSELAPGFSELQQSVFKTHLFYAQHLDKAPDIGISTEITKQGAEFAIEAAIFLNKLRDEIKIHQ